MSYHCFLRSGTHPASLQEPWNLATRAPLPIGNYLKALYLFTRSDLKTIVLPIVCLRIYPNPLYIE